MGTAPAGVCVSLFAALPCENFSGFPVIKPAIRLRRRFLQA